MGDERGQRPTSHCRQLALWLQNSGLCPALSSRHCADSGCQRLSLARQLLHKALILLLPPTSPELACSSALGNVKISEPVEGDKSKACEGDFFWESVSCN